MKKQLTGLMLGVLCFANGYTNDHLTAPTSGIIANPEKNMSPINEVKDKLVAMPIQQEADPTKGKKDNIEEVKILDTGTGEQETVPLETIEKAPSVPEQQKKKPCTIGDVKKACALCEDNLNNILEQLDGQSTEVNKESLKGFIKTCSENIRNICAEIVKIWEGMTPSLKSNTFKEDLLLAQKCTEKILNCYKSLFPVNAKKAPQVVEVLVPAINQMMTMEESKKEGIDLAYDLTSSLLPTLITQRIDIQLDAILDWCKEICHSFADGVSSLVDSISAWIGSKTKPAQTHEIIESEGKDLSTKKKDVTESQLSQNKEPGLSKDSNAAKEEMHKLKEIGKKINSKFNSTGTSQSPDLNIALDNYITDSNLEFISPKKAVNVLGDTCEILKNAMNVFQNPDSKKEVENVKKEIASCKKNLTKVLGKISKDLEKETKKVIEPISEESEKKAKEEETEEKGKEVNILDEEDKKVLKECVENSLKDIENLESSINTIMAPDFLSQETETFKKDLLECQECLNNIEGCYKKLLPMRKENIQTATKALISVISNMMRGDKHKEEAVALAHKITSTLLPTLITEWSSIQWEKFTKWCATTNARWNISYEIYIKPYCTPKVTIPLYGSILCWIMWSFA